MLRVLFATALLMLAAPAAGDGGEGQGEASTCVRFWGEARYGAYGYDHIVHIANGCKSRARCEVSTNVNPAVVEVTVPSEEEVEVNTFRGSPAREFTPKVECTLEADRKER